ncbi:MAG TPA: VOC family protein [Micromonosporaceae bacterium]|jgi:catechol 2,3-dioxygenase-like lactoylglutathione lyase family enzyme|nr:VOC family protein [Micromonosporaceae bacterium]
MIDAIHLLLYSKDAAADRAFLRDTLGLSHVDDGDGWLIFKLPPAEIGVHPTDGAEHHEIHLMCTDVSATVAELTAKGVELTGPVTDQGWGLVTGVRLPGGGTLGLYQPKHATAYDL